MHLLAAAGVTVCLAVVVGWTLYSYGSVLACAVDWHVD